MKFSDKKVRDNQIGKVIVKRTPKEMMERDEYNSHLWGFEKVANKNENFYTIPIRDLKIGENVYNDEYEFICYRVE